MPTYKQDSDHLQQYRENHQIEAKQVLGGLPESIGESYFAFYRRSGEGD